jgi:PAN domain
LAQTRIQELRAKEPKVDVDLSAGSALQDSQKGIGLKGDVIASDAGIPIAKCWDDCSTNQSCVAAEHDQEFSRCNLYSRVEEKIRSPRFTSFVRSNRGVKLDQRVQLFANTGLQGEVIESTPYLSKDDCRSACIENKGCVAAEHDEAFSRCTLFSSVARSVKSPRYTTFLIDGYILK